MLITLVICIMCFCNCCLTSVIADLTVCSAGIPGNLFLHLQNELALIQFSLFSFDCTVWFSKSDPTGPVALTSVSAWDGYLKPHRHTVSSFWPFMSALVRYYRQAHLRYKTQLGSSRPEHLIHISNDGKSLNGSLKMIWMIWNQSLITFALKIQGGKRGSELGDSMLLVLFSGAINSLAHYIIL